MYGYIDMNRFLRWLGFETRTTPADDPGVVLPPRLDVLPESQLLATINVYRAVSLLTLGAAQLTVDVWRGGEQIPRPSIVRRPDVNTRWRPWVKQCVSSLALTGNCYWRITRNDRGEPISISVLDPHECEPAEDGTLRWGRRDKPLRPDEFRHLKLLSVPGRLKGLGPIQAARTELAGAVQVSRYGAEFFATGDVPSGILKSDQYLTPEQAQTYKTIWQSRKAHEVAVLGQGLDYRPVLLSPEDAQFIATRQFDTTAIARLFGIPARLFLAQVEGGSMTYANVGQEDLSFVRWTLHPTYLSEVEDALSSVLPGVQEARFNLDGVLRPDAATRAVIHQQNLASGWMSVNEVRQIEGLPPLPGMDLPRALHTAPPEPEEEDPDE